MTTTTLAPDKQPAVRVLTDDERSLAVVEELIAAFTEVGPVRTPARRYTDRPRAQLALAASRALGVAVSDGRTWAAGVELAHQTSLKVVTGDSFILPSRAIARCSAPDDVKWRLTEAISRGVQQVARGRADEPELRHRIVPDAWRVCVRKKSALFAVSVEGAALLAGRGAREATVLARPFVKLGELFQMAADLIEAFVDERRAGGDVDAGRVSSLVTAHLARVPADRAWLFAVLDAPRAEDLDDVIARYDDGGALDDVLTAAFAVADDILATQAIAAEPALAPVVAATIRRVLHPLEAIAATRPHRAQRTASIATS